MKNESNGMRYLSVISLENAWLTSFASNMSRDMFVRMYTCTLFSVIWHEICVAFGKLITDADIIKTTIEH